MKKILAAALCAVMLAGCRGITGTVNAETAFESYISSITKTVFEGTYGWEAEMKAERMEFDAGYLSFDILDFDGDGQKELAVLQITKPESEEAYAEAVIEMYEYENGEVVLSDASEGAEVLSYMTDAGGMEFFRVGNILLLQCAVQNNTFADGVFQNIRAYSYDGEKFVEELSFDFVGSAIEMADEEDFISDLEKIGLEGCAETFREEEWYNPYFCGEDGLNLAHMEDKAEDLEKYAYIYITNNTESVYEEIDVYNDDWNSILIEKAKMTVKSGAY